MNSNFKSGFAVAAGVLVAIIVFNIVLKMLG
jgi:hypothetical protein